MVQCLKVCWENMLQYSKLFQFLRWQHYSDGEFGPLYGDQGSLLASPAWYLSSEYLIGPSWLAVWRSPCGIAASWTLPGADSSTVLPSLPALLANLMMFGNCNHLWLLLFASAFSPSPTRESFLPAHWSFLIGFVSFSVSWMSEGSAALEVLVCPSPW